MSCVYCRMSKSEPILMTKHDQVFIDPDEKKIVWEHTEFFPDISDPWDGTEDTLTVEIKAGYCPICGARLEGSSV